MTTGLQLALAAGALMSLGWVLLVIRLTPAEPDLAEALSRLTPARGERPRSGRLRILGQERIACGR